jgi:hypothetical protein
MDITLTIIDEGHVQEPAREGARLFDALFPPGSRAREALGDQQGNELAGEEPLPTWLGGEGP